MSTETLLQLRVGAMVRRGEDRFRIVSAINLQQVLGMSSDGQEVPLLIADLKPIEGEDGDPEQPTIADLQTIPESKWQIARQRFRAIKPLLTSGGKKAVVQRAVEEQTSAATLYRWLRAYDGHLSSLIPTERGPAPGTTRLTTVAEELMKAAIDSYYLRKGKTITSTHLKIKAECARCDVSPPHITTLMRRIDALKDSQRAVSRRSRKKRRQVDPATKRFDEAQRPLGLVQIDHTPADVMLVDDVNRLPLGRPWLTLAIDVFTRVVTGFHVSFEAPSGLATGQCIAMSILRKDRWLADRDLDLEWPLWGIPQRIHVDNGPDFRGEMLRAACEEYDIDLHFRPVRVPKYGGHIERLMGTTGSFLRDLAGATGRNILEREGLEPEKHAALTLNEFERYLAHALLGRYHQDKHTGIGMPPINALEDAYFNQGAGLPAIPTEERRIVLDFLPHDERSVQRYGILWESVYYYEDCLRHWIGSRNDDGTKARKFIVRRDPRDISRIFFFDPEAEDYFEIGYADMTRPAMSLWELREAKRRLKESGITEPNEEQVFQSFYEMEKIEEEAIKTTKAVRRRQQRRAARKNAVQTPKPKTRQSAKTSETPKAPAPDFDSLEPFQVDFDV